jgi:antitoxin component of MazEF toxin-antitoxin module
MGMTSLNLKQENKKLKKIIKLGDSTAITIPTTWIQELGSPYVWVSKQDHEIIITPAYFKEEK